VATWGSRAVEIMVDRHDANTVKMGAAGVCDAVAIAMQSHQSVAEIECAGCGAVAGLSQFKQNAVKLGVAGVCDSVLFSIHMCFFDVDTVSKACTAISRLAVDPPNSAKLLGADVATTLMCIVCRHSNSARASECVWNAIRSLSTGNADAVRSFSDAGACDQLISHMMGITAENAEKFVGVAVECMRTVVVFAEASDEICGRLRDAEVSVCQGIAHIEFILCNKESPDVVLQQQVALVKKKFT
jgi:hypothetical protein